MSYPFRALSGPLAGQVFNLREGLTFGRRGADVTLDDGRVSTRHARIVREAGQWRLVDEGSKNGVRDGRGQKVAVLDLVEGVRFSIGESEFAVGPRAEAKPRAKAAAPGKKSVFWHEALAAHLKSQAGRLRDDPRELEVLAPALALSFVRGPQVDTRWVLGFGPREIGPASFDLPLWQDDLPPICFHIHPTAAGPEFRTPEPGLVRLNGQSLSQKILATGDYLEIRETMIELELVE